MGESKENTEQVSTGGCVCGSVQFEAYGPPEKTIYCHCTMCRRQTGAPVVTFVVFQRDKVQFTKGVRRCFESRPGAMRGFCDQCGTPLTWEGEFMGDQIVEFYISTLDNPDAFPPTLHASVSQKISWFDIDDGLPRHQGSSVEPADPS